MRTARLSIPVSAELAEVENRIKASLSLIGEHASELSAHVMAFRGKRIRPMLTLLSAKCNGGIKDQHLEMACLVELFHNATLLHDDVLDEAQIRRNIPTFNARWGNDMAVLFGDYICAAAIRICARLNDNRAIKILADATHEVCLGELLQTWNKGKYDIAESLYMDFIEKKTAALFSASCRLGCLSGSADEERANSFAEFGILYGTAFQIADDYMDITGNEGKAGKSLGTDIEKGKVTLPILKLVESLRGGERTDLLGLLSSHRPVSEKKDILSSLLNKHGIADYTRGVVADLTSRAARELDGIEESPSKAYMLFLAEGISETCA